MKSFRFALLQSFAILVLALLTIVGVQPAFAQTRQRADASEMPPPRIGMITGDASFWRPGASDWSPAQVNTPLAAGDSLYTGDGATLEVQVGTRAYLRLAQRAMFQLLRNDGGVLQIKISSGIAALDLRSLQSGRSIELDTPSGVFSIDSAGYYRVEVSDSSTNIIVRRGGNVVATLADGSRRMIAPSQEAVIDNGDSSRDIETYVAPDADAWDQWNYARSDDLIDAISNRYVSPDVYGTDDLDHYGNWRVTPDYGPVWIPSGMASDWAPYSTGSWVWDPVYEWTWVDARPWGWAPYHYGRWVNISGYWAWAPGPRVVRPAYAPALVAFFHTGGGAVASFGGPGVSWVALSWGEPVLPWWGRQRHNFVGRPWWGGWGGPRVVNNVVVHNTTVINNVTNIRYRNFDQQNAVIAVRENNFGHGPITGGTTRIEPSHTKDWRPIAGATPMRPAAASMTPVQSKSVVPTQATVDRPVVMLHNTPAHLPPSRAVEQQAVEAQRPVMNKDRVITNRPQNGQVTPWASFGKGTGPERAEPRQPPEPPRNEEWGRRAAPQVQEPRQVARPTEPEPVRPSMQQQQQQRREPERIIGNEPAQRRESPPAFQEQRQMPRAVVPQQVMPQLRQEPPAMVNSPPVQHETQLPVPPRERSQEAREQHQQREQHEQREQPRNENRSEAPSPLPGRPANQLFQRREAHAEQPHKAEQAKPKSAN